MLDYIDASGKKIAGRIDAIDQRGQHMKFTILFTENPQAFHGWIFSWDKKSVAGTTQWNGRTFGFYAIKN